MHTDLQLSSSEIEMMNEVFGVFKKYADKTRSFGLQLVHSHFPIAENEILYETHDKKNRVLTVVPVDRDSLKTKPLATAWQQTKNGGITVAMFCCDGGDSGDDGSGGASTWPD